MNYQSVVIIGAPRSGTNMLRNVLCEFQGVGTWPCDEINYIWSHGNIKEVTDEFSANLARPKVKRFIRKEFDKFAKSESLNFLVDKTCANSLRVSFIEEVAPKAMYIFIVRDGVDAVGSAMIRWKAKLDIPYILKKARYVPFMDLPYYAIRYFSNRVYRSFSKEGRLSFWGPKIKGLDQALGQYSLAEVCALQWQRCVDLSEEAFLKIPKERVIKVSYEAFVSQPAKELSRILQQLNIEFDESSVNKAIDSVSDRSIGKGRKALNERQLQEIEKLVASTLKRYGYDG